MKTRVHALLFLLSVCIFFTGAILGWHQYNRGNTIEMVSVKRILATCETVKSDPKKYIACLRYEFHPVLRVSTLKQILSHVEIIAYENVAGTIKGEAWCHEVGHVLGEETAKMGMPASNLIQYCGTSCGYGCIHGIIYMKARMDPTLMSNLDTLCVSTKDNPVSLIDRENCTHGIGHFLTEYSSYDIKKSLLLCESLIPQPVRGQCMAGAIMEMFAQKDQEQAPFSLPSDIVAYCSDLTIDARQGCVGLLSSMKPEQSIHEGMVTCSRMPVEYIDACVEGKAEKLYKQEHGIASAIVSTCIQEAPYTTGCVNGAVLVSFNMDPTGVSAQNICEAGTGQIKTHCIEYVRKLTKDMQKK